MADFDFDAYVKSKVDGDSRVTLLADHDHVAKDATTYVIADKSNLASTASFSNHGLVGINQNEIKPCLDARFKNAVKALFGE